MESSILFLSETQILEMANYQEIMAQIESAYEIFARNHFFMPDRIHIDHEKNTLLYMPCFKEGIFGTKMLTVFPENAGRYPVIDGLMLLNDESTGRPLALLDGKALTALRTGAVGGVGIRYTAKRKAHSIGLIGAGAQGFYQLLYGVCVRDIRDIYIYDAYKQDLSSFIGRLKEKISPDISIHSAKNGAELLQKSDIIITCTTAKAPVLPDEKEALRGKHFIGIGSYKPDMREMPDALFDLVEEVLVDTPFAAEESGDLLVPMSKGKLSKQQIRSFSCQEGPRYQKQETTFFKSVGMALFDLVVAEYIYKKALAQKQGTIIK